MKEIKNAFSQKIKLVNSYRFKYNNTLYGLDSYNDISSSLNHQEKQLYNQLNPFYFFNTIEHDNIMIVGRIIKPIANVINSSIANLIFQKVTNLRYITTLIIILYFFCISFWYIFIWN